MSRWSPSRRLEYDILYKPDPSPPDVPDRPGWIYVVSSPDMPGLLKVGLTIVNVAERVKGLSANSSTPRPLVLERAFPSDAVDYDEWHIHKLLKPHHHGKEWFRVDLSVVIAACRLTIDDVVSERERPLLRHGSGASNLVLALDGLPDDTILPQDIVSSATLQHQIGANPTLDRNSQQAKIAGRSHGLTVDLRGH